MEPSLDAAIRFLSVPLTMMIEIALDSRPDTHWIAVLLGPESAAADELAARTSEPDSGSDTGGEA